MKQLVEIQQRTGRASDQAHGTQVAAVLSRELMSQSRRWWLRHGALTEDQNYAGDDQMTHCHVLQ